MKFRRKRLADSTLLQLYTQLVKPRMIEEKMLNLLRQGKVSKWFSGIGQEAISVGVTAALLPDEYVFTMHRNLGVFTTREMPLPRLFAQWQGKVGGYTKGRDRSFHFGAKEHHIVGMISVWHWRTNSRMQVASRSLSRVRAAHRKANFTRR
jgi:2-oxoisovalerate dehydrogenase E1 component